MPMVETRRMVRVVAVICLLGAGRRAWAAPVAPLSLGLGQAIRNARRENLKAMALADRRDALLARRLEALGPDEPDFAAVGYGPGSALGPAGSVQVQASQAFGFPGKASARARSLSLQAQTLGAEIQAGLLEGDREATRDYDELWFAGRALQWNALKAQTFGKIAVLARRRMVKGTTSEVEYLRARASLAGVDDEKADLEAAREDAQAALDSLMGLPVSTRLQLRAPPPPDPGTPPPPPSPDSMPHNPVLAAARLQVEADRARLLAARRGALPDFDASVLESRGQFGAGLSLSLPLWYWFNERHAVAAALKRVQAGREGALEARRRVGLRLREELSLLSSLARKLGNNRDNLVPLDARAWRLALSNYHYGQIDYNSLQAAANAWLDARMNQEALKRDYREALADLDYLEGK